MKSTIGSIMFTALAGLASYGAWKFASQDKPDRVAVVSLVIAAGVSLAMATWGNDLVRRIRKLGTAGIELEVWQEIVRIPEMKEAPEPPKVEEFDDSSQPAETAELTLKQQWFYELGSNVLFHLRHRGVKAEDLAGEDLRRYRKIVIWVGKTALNQNNPFKALDILESIEHLDKLSQEEWHWLGMANFLVATSQEGTERYRELLRHSADVLGNVVAKDPKDGPAHWMLGYIYDELGLFERAIEHDTLAIASDETRYWNVGFWNMSVSYLKKGQRNEALDALEKIPAGDCWGKIYEDEELGALRGDELFEKLYTERRTRRPVDASSQEAEN